MQAQSFASYGDFWPYYVAMHSRSSTRWVHLTGTLTGAALTAVGIATMQWWLIIALPVCGYGAAWPSHWLIEKNNPASFGHPLWSFRGDIQMITTMLLGRDHDLTAIAHGWLSEHPDDRSTGSLPVEHTPRAA